MRALIAGASGAIGRALVHRLRANQHEVFALTQSRDSAAVLTEIGAEPVSHRRRKPVASGGVADRGSRVLQEHLRHLTSAKERRFERQAPTRSTTRRGSGALRTRNPGASSGSVRARSSGFRLTRGERREVRVGGDGCRSRAATERRCPSRRRTQASPRNYPGSCSKREPKRPKATHARNVDWLGFLCGALAAVLI
jgi:hypothetical protein